MKLIKEVTTKANNVIRDMSRTFTPEKVIKTPNYLPVSSFAIKNIRRKMEDRHIILRDLNTLYDMQVLSATNMRTLYDMQVLSATNTRTLYNMQVLSATKMSTLYNMQVLSATNLHMLYHRRVLFATNLHILYDRPAGTICYEPAHHLRHAGTCY